MSRDSCQNRLPVWLAGADYVKELYLLKMWHRKLKLHLRSYCNLQETAVVLCELILCVMSHERHFWQGAYIDKINEIVKIWTSVVHQCLFINLNIGFVCYYETPVVILITALCDWLIFNKMLIRSQNIFIMVIDHIHSV